jgi:surface antigen
MKPNHWIYLTIGLVVLISGSVLILSKVNVNNDFSVGQKIDSLNGVYVFCNGSVDNIEERNTTPDGYNLGLKYQCVEFVKRYYYEHLNHKMPNSYGNAKDFFDHTLQDGQMSNKRGLIQYNNPSDVKPQIDDLLIFDGTRFNKYGHVAIISRVTETTVEIIQQNPGPNSKSRESFALHKTNGKWKINHNRILGWLRKV